MYDLWVCVFFLVGLKADRFCHRGNGVTVHGNGGFVARACAMYSMELFEQDAAICVCRFGCTCARTRSIVHGTTFVTLSLMQINVKKKHNRPNGRVA